MSTTVEHSLISKNNEVQNHDGKKDEVKLNKQMRIKYYSIGIIKKDKR
jgi:hypothetical protein